MKITDAAKFCHRFATGHRAGVDVVRLLQSETSHGSSRQRREMQALADGASRGHQLHELMQQAEPYYPVLLTAMTEVGEETGKLERALFVLAKHFQHRVDMRRKFIRSISWPVFQLFAGIAVLSLLIYIMGIMRAAGGAEMTDILGLGLRGPEGVLKFWGYLVLIFGSIGLFIAAFFQNWFGLQNLAPLLYMIPKIGPAIQTITIARFCHTMALALDAGLDPIRSIALSCKSTGSSYYASGIADSEKAIRQGSTLSGALNAMSVFPEDFIARVDISEHSGTDAEAMQHLAAEYDERAEDAVKFMSMLATILVRMLVGLVLIFFIFRIAMTYINALSGAMEPINPRRGR
ncbi:putative type II secretion system protein F [Rubripirellula amarantea]|uniref:Putative type II secretion system protein F n=1 Tax=Rubripirellula amarantea TaxID=2527999 RepID=A0A5C5WTB6_9BACT|nr:type II secretion system F family protein [Rubripirellula amarantea]TWT53401.1 putative type II secretion system protein F [Rubripirellula amarantea]